jgi:hypothetical protein
MKKNGYGTMARRHHQVIHIIGCFDIRVLVFLTYFPYMHICINIPSSNATEIWLSRNILLSWTLPGHLATQFLSPLHDVYIITLLLFFIEMLQYDWLWSGHMIIKEAPRSTFYTPIKLQKNAFNSYNYI